MPITFKPTPRLPDTFLRKNVRQASARERMLLCQSGVWKPQRAKLTYVEFTVASSNAGSGAADLGNHLYCALSAIGGERPHGYVYRTSDNPDTAGRYPFQAQWRGYNNPMDLRVACFD